MSLDEPIALRARSRETGRQPSGVTCRQSGPSRPLTAPPFGLYLIALASRFAITRCTRPMSHRPGASSTLVEIRKRCRSDRRSYASAARRASRTRSAGWLRSPRN